MTTKFVQTFKKIDTKSVPNGIIYNRLPCIIMIDTTHSYHSPAPLTSQQLGLAIFYLNQNGPDLLDYRLGSDLFDVEIENIFRFGVYSMVSLTQGDYYRDNISQLPVQWKPGYQAIICSTVEPGEIEIHARYFQLVFFVPESYISYLPNISQIKSEIFEVFGSLNDYTTEILTENMLSVINNYVVGH